MVSFLYRAYFYGIKECFNPYSLAIVLYFVLYISLVGNSYKRIIIQGLSVLFLTEILYALIAAGVLDKVILNKKVIISFQYFYLVVGILFIIFAILNFIDWFKLRVRKKSLDSLFIRMPFFLSLSENRTKNGTNVFKNLTDIFFIVYGHILGCCFVISQTIWPVDVFIYRMYVVFLSGGHGKYIWLFFSSYAFGYISLLIVSWIGILFIAKKNEGRVLNIKKVAVIKIIFSALYLSVGVGISYLFYF